MTFEENYLDWLRDAHAMEKQAESMLEKMAGRIEHYPDLKARIEKHIEETRQQQTWLDEILERNGDSNSTTKDVMGKMMAFGQAVGGMTMQDEIVKGCIASIAFEQTEVACYTSLIAAAETIGRDNDVTVLKRIRDQEQEMAQWLLNYLPYLTEEFMKRSAEPDTEAKR